MLLSAHVLTITFLVPMSIARSRGIKSQFPDHADFPWNRSRDVFFGNQGFIAY